MFIISWHTTGCILISAAGLASGVSPSYSFLVVCRAIVGFGVGGAVVPFDLLAEFLPNKHRGTFLIYIEGFWTIGKQLARGGNIICWIVYYINTLILLVVTAGRVDICGWNCVVGSGFWWLATTYNHYRHSGQCHQLIYILAKLSFLFILFNILL